MRFCGATTRFAVLAIVAAVLTATVVADEPLPDLPPDFHKPKGPRPPLAEFNIAKTCDEIRVPVQIQGKTYSFLLDTGATLTVYDERFRNQLGEPLETIQTKTALRTIDLKCYRSPRATLGSIRIRTGESVACVDLRRMSEFAGDPVDGILGLAFLKSQKFSLDFEHCKLRFLEDIPSNAGEPIPIQFIRGNAYAMLKLPVVGYQSFLIDTGNTGGIDVEKSVYERLEKGHALRTVKTGLAADVSGAIERELNGELSQVTLGNLLIPSVSVGVSERNLIGMELLSRLDVTFDFPNERMYVRPGKRFQTPLRWDLSGLHMTRRLGAVRIEIVDPESTAANVGLRAEDIVTHINGRDVSKDSLCTVRREFMDPGRKLVVAVRRRDQNLEFKLSLPNSPARKSLADRSTRSSH